MWDENSALWRAITQSGEDIPKFEDIALPGYMKYGSTQNDIKPAVNNTSMFLNFLLLNAVIKSQIAGADSPGPSATETFQSPNVNTNSANVISSQVKKNLFPTIKPGQSVLQNSKPTHLSM